MGNEQSGAGELLDGNCLDFDCSSCQECCEDGPSGGGGGGGGGGAARDLGGALLGGGGGMMSMMGGMGGLGDLVMGVALGAMMYQMLGGNRPSRRYNNPNVRNYTPPPVPPPRYGPAGRKGVMIGINYYGQKGQLSGCINDVQRVAQRLGQHYQLLVLVDSPQQDPRQMPTRANIMNSFRWLTGELRPGGGQTIFLHFSGHGSQQPDDDGEEADGMDETICPLDYARAGMISDDELKRDFLCKIPPGNRLLSVMDCCHSGTVLDLPFYAIASGQEANAKMLGDQMSEKNRIPCDALMISGCQDAQTSADVGEVGQQFVELRARGAGGALTSALLQAFAQNPGHNLASMLFGIRRALEQKGYDQIPQLSASQPYCMRSTVFDLFPESFAAAQQLAGTYQPPPPQMQQQQAPQGFPPQPQPQRMGYPPNPQQPYSQQPYPQQAQRQMRAAPPGLHPPTGAGGRGGYPSPQQQRPAPSGGRIAGVGGW